MLEDENFFERLELKTATLTDGLKQIFIDGGLDVQAHRAGSMFGLFFNARDVVDYETAATSDQERFKRWFGAMLEEKIYMAPSQFETLFMSAAHSDEDLQRTLDSARRALEKIS